MLTNDDTLSPADAALAQKTATLIEPCFRRLETTGLRIRPVYHSVPHRIVAHVKLCVLALLLKRAAEVRAKDTWRKIAHVLEPIQAIELQIARNAIVRTSKLSDEAHASLLSLGVSTPKDSLEVRKLTRAALGARGTRSHL